MLNSGNIDMTDYKHCCRSNNDLVFTKKGIYPIIKNKIKPFVAYSEINAGEELIIGDCSISINDVYDIFALMDMIEKIADIV